MPYETTVVPADRYLSHKGVTLFQTYKDNMKDNGPLTYTFTLDKFGSVENSIDVRKLAGWDELKHPPFLVGENNTPENANLWVEWRKSKKEEVHIKKVLKKYIEKLLKEGYQTEEARRQNMSCIAVKEVL